MNYQKLTPEIGAIINDIDLNNNLDEGAYNKNSEQLSAFSAKNGVVCSKNHVKWTQSTPVSEHP